MRDVGSVGLYYFNRLTRLKTVFRDRLFVEACGHGLGINERLIKEDQQEYHDEMKANYRDLARELSIIMHEQVSTLLPRLQLPNQCNCFQDN